MYGTLREINGSMDPYYNKIWVKRGFVKIGCASMYDM